LPLSHGSRKRRNHNNSLACQQLFTELWQRTGSARLGDCTHQHWRPPTDFLPPVHDSVHQRRQVQGSASLWKSAPRPPRPPPSRVIYLDTLDVIHKAPSLAEQDAEGSKALPLLQQYAELDTRWEDIIHLPRSNVPHPVTIKHMPKLSSGSYGNRSATDRRHL
jgi:hypothetical protein